MKFKSAIMALMLVLPIDTSAATCSSYAISKMQVKTGCDCSLSAAKGCGDCPLQCGQPPKMIVPFSKLSTCGKGCVDANNGCSSCSLWFESLCTCIKRLENGLATNCISSEDLTQTPPSKAIWMLLNSQAEITTTDLVPGILELGGVFDSDAGFRFGQGLFQKKTISNRAHGTLALNSVATRDEEQIHIHVCDNPHSKLRPVLSALKPSAYSKLKSVQLPVPPFEKGEAMSCRASPKKGEPVDMARDIKTYLQTAQGCEKYYVGAGVITDLNGYSWACVTTGTKSAEDLFCKL